MSDKVWNYHWLIILINSNLKVWNNHSLSSWPVIRELLSYFYWGKDGFKYEKEVWVVLGSFSATIRHMLVTSLRRTILFKVFVLIIIFIIIIIIIIITIITSRTIKILQFLFATFVCNEEVSTNLLHFRSLKTLGGQSGIGECVNN